MGKSDMFAVRGITTEARKAAKVAAAAEGKTLGAWLSDVITHVAYIEAKRRYEALPVEERPREVPTKPGTNRTEFRYDVAPKNAETVANKEGIAERERIIAQTADGIAQGIATPLIAAGRPLHPEARAKKAPKGKKQCQHGTAKGENCWKCGGLARVE